MGASQTGQVITRISNYANLNKFVGPAPFVTEKLLQQTDVSRLKRRYAGTKLS
jgi:hypothetical protein